jgi:hypothetical protein
MSTTTSETRSRAASTASTAADESRHVGRVAGEEAQNVAGEAAAQLRNLAGEARTQVEEQSRSQRDRLVSTLHTFSDDLDSMSRAGMGAQGIAGDVVRMLSKRARELGSRLEGREPSELIDDARGYARRRPGTFLLGSLAAGVLVGRLVRGAKDAGGSSGVAQRPERGMAGDPAVAPAPTTATIVDEPIPVTGAAVAPGGAVTEQVDDGEPGVHRGTP